MGVLILCLVSVAKIFSFMFMICDHVVTCVNGGSSMSPHYLGDVAINCGSHGNSAAIDGREWIGEAQFLQPKGKSRSSAAAHKSLSADPIPYMTARTSATQFLYNFQVSPGQKFIRLHFYPAIYGGFEKSQDFFTVNAGPFTLLSNFSASLAADDLGVTYIVKEFCLNIEEGKNLYIIFSASRRSKVGKFYAFVNGIEIISMPSGLYYTPDGDSGACILGQNHRFFYIDNSTALELVQRLNIGGSSILPIEDFGMFRRWSEDTNYFLEFRTLQVNPSVGGGIKSTNRETFFAPQKLYQTSWKARKKLGAVDKVQNFTWKIPVHLGFVYLVRLHFCDFELGITERFFNVLINDQIAETNADVIRWSGDKGIPVYRDYVVIMKGNKEEGKSDLLIAIESYEDLVIAHVKGLEIFKLSNIDNSLAAPNPVFPNQASTFWTLKIQNFLLDLGLQIKATVTFLTILTVLVSSIVYILREICEKNFHGEEEARAATTEQSCRCFSLGEIKSATQNFSHALMIGKGGFGKVYKGFISGGSQIVAVKRLMLDSKQGPQEFWAEIDTLSKLRHVHLVSLIGYCNEEHESILVYEYISRGTLADNLYKNGRNGNDGIHLTWEQRLKICIGAARGLDYLHTGIEHGVIHRDVKDTNILLDENFVAKISDFGLSKLEMISQSKSYVISKVKGSYGYLDPHYMMTQKLTRKTDVYAFGVVLLVALCGKPAVDTRVPGEPQILLSKFRECVAKREIDLIIDPCMQGKISTESLTEFIKSVESCLHHEPKKRPMMTQVVVSLEYALEQQESTKSSIPVESTAISQPSKIETIQPSQVNPEESFFSIRAEVITNKAIKNAHLQTRGEVLQSRERVQKSFWGWPWEVLKTRGKGTKKRDNNSAPQPQPQPKDLVSPNLLRFSLSDIQSATDDFSYGRAMLIDEFRTVYLGTMEHFRNREEVAIYRFKTELQSREILEFCNNEIKTISQLRHPNLQPLIGYCFHENEMFALYPYTGNGILRYSLYDNCEIPLQWHLRLRICIGIARGLEYLHAHKIIHCDLRPENILLDENWTPKVVNFGLLRASPLGHSPKSSTLLKWSWWEYLPQDVAILGEKVTEKCDVYSFGLVLLEVLCGRRPLVFDQMLDEEARFLQHYVKRSIRTKTLDQTIDSSLKGQIAGACLAEFLKIAFSCLLDQGEERPSMRDVVGKLEFALLLQEKAAAEQKQPEDEDIHYEDISDLAVKDDKFNTRRYQPDELDTTLDFSGNSTQIKLAADSELLFGR